MLSGTSGIYKSWDISIPQIIKPSKLYRLEPIGLGTPYVESLTSYICRLADAHCVRTGTLILKEIIPRIQKYNSVHNRKALYRNSGAINNCGYEGSYKSSIVLTLEDLCQRKDLSSLTMSTWRDYLYLSTLHNTNRKWCPFCFSEWRKMQTTIYEPLLWKIRHLKICPIHRTMLIEKCTNKLCNKTNKHLGGNLNNGYCEHCNEWLGLKLGEEHESQKVNMEDEIREYEFDIFNLLQLLTISQVQSGEQIKQTLNRNFIFLKEEVTNKNLGQDMKKAREILKNCVLSRNILSIESLFFICSVFGITINELMSQELQSTKCTETNENKVKKKYIKRRQIDWNSIEKMLGSISNAKINPLPSVNQVAKDFGIDKTSLRGRFPELTKAISENYLKQKREMYLENINCTKKEIQAAIFKFHQLGIYPSANRVAKEIGRPAIMMQKELHNYWKIKLCELGYLELT